MTVTTRDVADDAGKLELVETVVVREYVSKLMTWVSMQMPDVTVPPQLVD